MQVFSITWRQPGWRIRMVIIIIVYVGAFRLAPHEVVPLGLGGTLGGLLGMEPARTEQAGVTPGGAL